MPSEWAQRRARSLVLMARSFENDGDHSYSLDDAANTIAAALDEAEKRGAGSLRQWLQEAASPKCRNCDGSGVFYGNVHICMCICDVAVANERNRLLARLREPDEALQDVVHPWVIKHYGWNWREGATAIIRAIADHLAKEPKA